MEYVLLVGLVLVCGYFIYINNQKSKEINTLRVEKDKMKDSIHSLTLEKNELSHLNIKLNGTVKQLTLENNYLKYQMKEVSKMLQKITSFKLNKPNKNEGTFDDNGFNPASLFEDDKPKENTKPRYNVDDILIEIGQVGIENVSKDKLEFLNNNNK